MTFTSQRTHPLYQHDQSLHTATTTVLSCQPLLPPNPALLSDAELSLFKSPDPSDYVVTTPATIFHAQGGGQPADTGSMTLTSTTTAADGVSTTTTFQVSSVRHGDASKILHCGRFLSAPEQGLVTPFAPGAEVTQTIDSTKRKLHSRIHTAGHLIGLAVRHLATRTDAPSIVSNGAGAFSEKKASHYPGDARVEFAGLIAGEHRAAIQKLANEYVQRALPVVIHFCGTLGEVKKRCGEDATKEMKMTEEMREEGGMRVVEVEGLGGYPCGGTHLPLTSDVLGIVVTGIKRAKGTSKVSYGIADAIPEEDR